MDHKSGCIQSQVEADVDVISTHPINSYKGVGELGHSLSISCPEVNPTFCRIEDDLVKIMGEVEHSMGISCPEVNPTFCRTDYVLSEGVGEVDQGLSVPCHEILWRPRAKDSFAFTA